MAFGIYFHIPYCLQRCTYCDFATYEKSQILPPEQYVKLVQQEILMKAEFAPTKEISTIYFGGGTPSLLEPNLILTLIETLEKCGFQKGPACEITIEINPATLNKESIKKYMAAGFNRFSVGAQTFDDALLKMVKREHSAQQTRETLDLLKSFNLNYSFDLLFALPHQTLQGLEKDLLEIEKFNPPHISPYCLTVPEGHVLTANRPTEDHQIKMFQMITEFLQSNGYFRYEISNFAKPGFESKHNSLYWNPDDEYWGLGLSAHSYVKKDWGHRFWNPNSIGAYEKQIHELQSKEWSSLFGQLPVLQKEALTKAQALTDFCHVSLRKREGLSLERLTQRFGTKALKLVENQLLTEQDRGHVIKPSVIDSWALTDEGVLLSNQVFSSFTFLNDEVPLP